MKLLLAALLLISTAAFAQSGWVDYLRNQNGMGCCFDNDGRRLDDPEWRTAGDSYEVLFTEGWVKVEPTAVVHMRNRDGIARVWSDRTPTRVVRCFLPGALG